MDSDATTFPDPDARADDAETPLGPPAPAEAVVDLPPDALQEAQFSIDYDREVELLIAEGKREGGLRPRGFRD